MPNSNPRWGWRPKGLAKARKRPYSADDVLRLANILGLSDSAEIAKLEAELQDHSRFYLVAKSDFDNAPRPTEMRAALRAVGKHLHALQAILDDLDAATRNVLDRVFQRVPAQDNTQPTGGSGLTRAEAQVQNLIRWAEISHDELPERWPPGGARFLFLFGLAQIYQTYTGEKPTRRYSEKERYASY